MDVKEEGRVMDWQNKLSVGFEQAILLILYLLGHPVHFWT